MGDHVYIVVFGQRLTTGLNRRSAAMTRMMLA
jgi:hypothetical protein